MPSQQFEIGQASKAGATGAEAAHKRTVKEKALDEARRFFFIALYLWILLSLFVSQETIVLQHEHAQNYTRFGFAIINALILAKVVLVAEDLHFARGLDEWPAIYPTIYKSVAFGVLCVAFYIVEEVLVGLWHGKVAAESLPPIAQRGPMGIILVAVILSVELVPLFALRELGRAMGSAELRALFFGRRG